jgi:hypothetical protein
MLACASMSHAAPRVPTTPATSDPILLDLQAAHARFPEDYATAVALAQHAERVGDQVTALQAWTAARTLSRANLETSLGPLGLHLALQDHAAAREDARLAVAAAPESASAWLAKGWVWRHEPAPWGLGSRVAATAYRRAARRDDTLSDPWCGLGTLRELRGDLLGARAAYAQARRRGDQGCAQILGGTTPLPWRLRAGIFGTVHAFHGNTDQRFGGAGLVRVEGSYGELVDLLVSGRALSLVPRDDTGSADQQEVWGRVGVRHGGHGADLTASYAHIDSSSSANANANDGASDSTRAILVGARAWATWWVTATASFARTQYDDAIAWQGGLHLTVPILSSLSLHGGAKRTSLSPPRPPPDGAPRGGPGNWSGNVAFRVHPPQQPWRLSLGGHFGPEVRPVRLDALSYWNLDRRLVGGASLGGGLQITDTWDLSLGYDLVVRDGRQRDTLTYQHLVTAGVTVSTP